MFETVRAAAFVAEDACDEGRVDEGFAGGFGALLFVGEDGASGLRGVGGCEGLGALARPFAGSGAIVCGFGAVVEAVFTVGERCVSQVFGVRWQALWLAQRR